MNNSTSSAHSVHFYESDEALIHRVCGIVSSGLLVGNSVLIVGTEQHREQLIAALYRLEVDVRDYALENRLVMYDAEELLSTFMADDMPDPALFLASIGSVFKEIDSPTQKDHGLVVFGEMVSVLWNEGNQSGALALERLWNELLNEGSIHLHCAYARAVFGKDEAGIFGICAHHSHIVGLVPHNPVGAVN